MLSDYTRLDSRYFFDGTLTLEHATHVGSGYEGKDTDTDSAFTVTGTDNTMYLPGSSVRGALRSTIERILMTLGKPTCLLYARDTNKDAGAKCWTANRELFEMEKKKIGGGEFSQAKQMELLSKNHDYICHTCRVFGSTFFASKVKIADAMCTKKTTLNARFGTGINRETGTVESGVLYSYEAAEKGATFKFELIAENMTADDLGVLSIGLLEMLEGNFWVGAKSAAGLGRCKLQFMAIRYFDGDKVKLADYLMDRKMEEKGEKDAPTVLRNWAKQYIDQPHK
jgi:CRISPR-associated RAMP protein (TIGR02581 family)